MRSVKFILAAGAASLMSTAVLAADMAIAPPPQMYAPPPVEDFGGWYLRGDIGFSNQKVKEVRHSDDARYAQINSFSQTTAFDTAGIFGVGVGYKFNNWFRGDLTAQYRGNSNLKGTDSFTTFNRGVLQSGVDNYSASKSELLFLANAYVDLGTWWCVTPFIGAGVGAARVTVANFTDNGLVNPYVAPGAGGATPADIFPGAFPSTAFAGTASKWNLAWAAHAGLAYQVNQNVTMELAYSYVNLGSGTTANDLRAFDGATLGNSFKFKDITSHDLKLGVRWNLEAAPTYAPPPPPLIRKG